MNHNTPAQEAKNLGTLFFTFFKIGLFTFGGGYAMIALLEEEFIQRRRWLDKDEFLDMTAIAESTPGPVAINSATYLGYKLAKVPGAATATEGLKEETGVYRPCRLRLNSGRLGSALYSSY